MIEYIKDAGRVIGIFLVTAAVIASITVGAVTIVAILAHGAGLL